MKNLIRGFFILIAITAFLSCKNGDTPQEVALKFAKSMRTFNFEETKSYATSNSQFILNQVEEAMKTSPLPDSIKQIYSQATLKCLNETIVNDSTAEVKIQSILPRPLSDKQEGEEIFILKKEQKTWKVDFLATMQKAMPGMKISENEQASPNTETQDTIRDTAEMAMPSPK